MASPHKLMANVVPIYQPTANPKHGAGGVEHQPKNIIPSELYWLLQGAVESNKRNDYKFTPEALLTKILIEGRADAGTNSFDSNNEKSWNMYDAVNEAVGVNDLTIPLSVQAELAGTFAAAVRDKAEVAKRLNIPFERAWNGTGVSARTGKSGQQHSDRYDQAVRLKSATHPKNAPVLDYITRALAGNLTPQEHLAARLPGLELDNFTTGGVSPAAAINEMFTAAPDSKQVKNMLNYIDPGLINNTVKNIYRRSAGIPELPLTGPGIDSTMRTETDILMAMPQVQELVKKLTGVAK